MTLSKEDVLGTEKGSNRSHYVENLLWKWQKACPKTDNRMNE